MVGKHRFLTRAALLLATLSLVLAGLILWQVRQDASHAADRTLATLALTQQLVEAQQNRDLSTRGELIAGNQAVVAYMTQALGSALPGEKVDTSSIIDLLEERRSQLGLDMAAVIAADGTLLANTDGDAGRHQFASDPVFAAARKAQLVRTGLWTEGGRLRHVAILPLARYGSGDAYLLVGQDVGQEFAQTIATIAAADVAIVVPSAAGPTLSASTLEADDAQAVLAALRTHESGDGARFSLALPNRDAQSQSAALFGNDAVRVLAVAEGRPLAAVVANHLPMLLFALIVVAIAALAVAWYWRQVEQPLHALERLLQRAADTGDTHLHLAERGSPAIARVAAAFNKLMGGRHAPRG